MNTKLNRREFLQLAGAYSMGAFAPQLLMKPGAISKESGKNADLSTGMIKVVFPVDWGSRAQPDNKIKRLVHIKIKTVRFNMIHNSSSQVDPASPAKQRFLHWWWESNGCVSRRTVQA